MSKAWFFLVCGLMFACDTDRFSGPDQADAAAGAAGFASAESDAPGLAMPGTGGSSSSSSQTNVAGSSSVAEAGRSSTGGSATSTGGSSTGGQNSTGGASASTGGSTSITNVVSTGGSSVTATGGSTFVGVSVSVPQTTVTYVVRYTIENAKSMWPDFRITYFNRSNQGATTRTMTCLEMTSGKGMECRFSVNQALSWEISACINSDCSYTIPNLDSTGYCAMGSGIQVFRVENAGLAEVKSGLVLNQTASNCNLIIQPGGFAPANTLDSDGDGIVDVNDCMPYNPSAHPPIVKTDREICYNELDENCSGSYDDGDCGNVVPPADTTAVSATLRPEVHWLLPNETGKTFASTDAQLIQIEPVYQEWPCQPASVADFVTGKFIQGMQCAVERDPTKEFVYQVRVGSQYLAGYSCSTPSTCLTHSFRDYVTVGGFPYAAMDDGKAGFPRVIGLRYVSAEDTVRAVVPIQ